MGSPGRGPGSFCALLVTLPTARNLAGFPWTQECGRCPMAVHESRARARTTRSTLIREIPAETGAASPTRSACMLSRGPMDPSLGNDKEDPMSRRCTMILGLGLAVLIACPAVAQQPKAKAKSQQPLLPEGVKVERDLAYGAHKERNTL